VTHTLHRRGREAGLCRDLIVLILPARGLNLEGSEEKMGRMWEVISHYRDKGLVNYGNLSDGNSQKVDLERLIKGRSRISHAVFSDRKAVEDCLREFKEQEFGISVVVSGLFEEAAEICRRAGLTPHTVEHSLGTHGRTERLPREEILEITTMCGHALIAPRLVESLVEKINQGKTTPAQAAAKLSRLCECGIFNPQRAEELLTNLAAVEG